LANTVGLALHVAREIELPLHGHALAADDHGLRGLRVAAHGECAQHHGGNAHPGGLARLADQTSDVPLRDVRQLMRQHRCKLFARVGHGQQTQVDADVATRQRKGVDRFFAHQEGPPGVSGVELVADLTALAGTGQQRCPDLVDMLQHQRVVDHVWVTQDGAHDAIAHAAFGSRAQAL